MRKQTGMFIDAQVWEDYRKLCCREKLRTYEPIEEYLRLVLRSGSAQTVLNMMRARMARPEGLEAYARVLLDWYKTGRHRIQVTDENEAPIEHMLLHALKKVADPQLRRDIQDALTAIPRKQRGDRDRMEKSTETEKPATEEEQSAEPAASAVSRIKNIQKQVSGLYIDADHAQELLNKVHQIREKLKGDRKAPKRKTPAKK